MSEIFISRKTQIILTDEQKEYVDTMIYVRRKIWNKLVETYNPTVKIYKDIPSQTKLEHFAKNLDLPKVHNRVYTTCCSDYITSWKRVFNKNIPMNLRRKPKFHSIDNVLSVKFGSMDKSKLIKGKFSLPRYQGCKIKKDFEFYEDLSEFKDYMIPVFTFSKRNDKYFISFTFKLTEYTEIQSESNQVGCDWGLKEFLTCSNGENFSMPKSLIKQEIRIKNLQRKLSNKQRNKGKVPSKNYNQLKKKLNQAWLRYVNIRKDFIEKTTYKLCRQNDLIVLEDLDLTEMIKKGHKYRRKNIYKNCFNIFKERLKQKSQRFSCIVGFVDKYYASSQICSNCGKQHKMPVEIRTYECECGLIIDRDLNAAINILNEGRRKLSSPCGLMV